MYGYTEAEALTMNICETVPDTHKKEALQLVKDAFAGKTINAFKTKRKTKDGKILDVWLSVTTLRDANGAPVSLATTERNITELARLL
jgi:two-component system CheB/CheR fusion protein